MKPIITVAAIDVKCPSCGEYIAGPSGALHFTIDEVRTGAVHICDCCKTEVTMPHLKMVRVA